MGAGWVPTVGRHIGPPAMSRPTNGRAPPQMWLEVVLAAGRQPQQSSPQDPAVAASGRRYRASPPRSLQPQLRIAVPAGSTLRKNATRERLGLTTTGAFAAASSGRSAVLSE